MIKGELKKEIYFTNDVIREVCKRTKLPEIYVKEVFSHYLSELKNEILETDYLFYGLNPLGVLSINRKELNRNIRKYKNKFYKEKDPEKKAKYKRYWDNFKIREKRMRVEEEKFKSVYPNTLSKVIMKKARNTMLKPAKFESKYYTDSIPLREAADLQNEYAYRWYEKNNKPVAH